MKGFTSVDVQVSRIEEMLGPSMTAGSAKPDTVMAALAGKSLLNNCVRNSVIRVV